MRAQIDYNRNMTTAKVVMRSTSDQTQVLDKGGDIKQTAPDIIFDFTIKTPTKNDYAKIFWNVQKSQTTRHMNRPTTVVRGLRSTLRARAFMLCSIAGARLRKKKRSSHTGMHPLENNAI